ncbi:Sister chromatid cohesion protein pds5 [Beauveria bassiana]|nr:Sister chromatid cohesion protein pds5 [Beauveria bassiana]KAH8716415.1 Sister chromatid cohesion protein pds5 [Beauveria bassiana]
MARRRGRAQEPAEADPVEEPQQPAVQETPADIHDEDMGDGDEEEEQQEQQSLVFDEELSWRPAKPIPSATLLARLERLSKELAEFDQGAVNLDSLKTVASQLAHRNLLQHKDRGVKAYTACCLVDLLRLYVPDAPFTDEQLKMMFVLFVKEILPALHDPTNPYDSQHKYVLMSLTDVKSILLICDVHGADDLLLRLFNSAFDGVSTSSKASPDHQVAKDVEIHLTDMLMHLIEESPGSVPASVIDAIISQFLRAAPPGGNKTKEANGKQSTLLHKTEPPAYIMAKNICNGCADKMSRYVSQYFSDVILNASGFATKNGYGHGDDSDEEDANSGPSEADLKSLRQAHALIRELWRAAPTILQNVVPQLDAELSADNVHLRHIATEAFGDMISGIGAAGPPPPPALDPAAWPPVRLMDEPGTPTEANVLTTPFSPQSFAQTHHATYRNFVSRKNDKSGTIRAAWVTAVGYILSSSAGGIGLSREDETELVRGLVDKLSDGEEKVRLAAVKAIELFQFRDVILKLGATGGVDKEGSLFASLSDRCRDRKASVRVDAMVLLGKLWAVGAADIQDGQEAVTACLGGVPSRIINSFYANDSDLNVLLDRVMFECLVPLKFPLVKGKSAKGGSNKNAMSQTEQDSIRAERILLMLKALDQPAQKAFFAMQARQPQFAKGVSILIQQCEAYNGGVIESNEEKVKASLAKTIDWIGRFFPDGLKVRGDLQKFAKLNERRSYQLVKYAIESESDFKTVRRAISELITKLQSSNAAVALDTLIPLLYRSSSLMFNRSHLATIMDFSKSDKNGLAAVAHLVLNDISQRNPDLFKAHAEELRKEIIEQSPSENKTNDPSLVDILKAYSSYAKKYPKDVSLDRSFIQTLTNYAMYGTPPKAAKFAINIMLAKDDDKSKVTATNLLRKAMQDIAYGKPHFLNKLATLSQLELLTPTVTMDEGDAIQDLTIKSILRQVHTDAKPGAEPAWVDDADMDEEIQAKCLALRILANQAIANQNEADAETKVKTVFKLLKTFVVSEGEFCKVKDTPQHHKKRLRLLAGLLMLKLCTIKKYDEQLDPVTFNKLAELVQDSEVQVRRRFMEKLQSYLTHGKLRARFLTILFLVAFEPVPEVKNRVETWLRSRALYYAENKKEVMEAIFGRLIPLLAHHPDYSASVDDLADFANYFLFYLNAVATEANLGLISKYAERTKQTRDAINPDASENLYVLSDLAQAIIRKYQEKRNWSFRVYPGKVGLATGLFAPLPSSEVAEEIAKKQYIPEALDEKLDSLLRSFERKKKRKSMHDPSEPSSKRSRTQIKTVIREKAASKQPKVKKAKKVKAARPKKERASIADEPGERRRSSRVTKTSDYKERDDKDDEDEMLDGVAEWKYGDDSSDEESEDEESGEESGDAEEEEEEEAEKGDEEGEEQEQPAAKNGRRAQVAKPAVKASVLAGVRRGGRSKRSSRGDDMDTDD